MNPIQPAMSLYLDTNAFIYAHFNLTQPEKAPPLEYYGLGEKVVDCLRACSRCSIRVFSTDLAYLEMYHNFHEWARLKQALVQGAPPGLLFGKGRSMDKQFLAQGLDSTTHAEVLGATAGWLRAWEFRETVEFMEPEAITSWFGIAKEIYTRYVETVLDCLHIAAAIALECNYFLTQDHELRKQLAHMREDSDFKQALIENHGLSLGYGLPSPAKAQSFNPVVRRNQA